MKKIISLISAFAMIATMFTTVAMADENNYLKWEVKSSSDTSLTADLVLKTSHALNQVQGTLKLANAKKNGLNNVTFTQTEGGKIGASAKTTLSIAYNSDVDIPAGEYIIGTVTLDYDKGSSYKLNEVARAVKLASMSEDFTNEFTNGFFDLEFPAKTATTVTSFTMTPATATVDGGKTQDFTVAIEGSGDGYDAFTYKVVDKDGADVTDTTATVSDKVITFTAPAATDAEQTFTITAESTADSSKTATSTVTVPAKAEEPKFTPAKGGDMINPTTSEKNKTYITGILEVAASEIAKFKAVVTDKATNEKRDFNLSEYAPQLKGEGTINFLAIVRYAGDTEKEFSIELVNE